MKNDIEGGANKLKYNRMPFSIFSSLIVLHKPFEKVALTSQL